MFQTQAVSPLIFRFTISMHAKIIRPSFGSSWSGKSGKTGKNAPSVTGGQRAVTLRTGVDYTLKKVTSDHYTKKIDESKGNLKNT